MFETTNTTSTRSKWELRCIKVIRGLCKGDHCKQHCSHCSLRDSLICWHCFGETTNWTMQVWCINLNSSWRCVFAEKAQTFPPLSYSCYTLWLLRAAQYRHWATGGLIYLILLSSLKQTLTLTQISQSHTGSKMINKSLELHSFPLVSKLGN